VFDKELSNYIVSRSALGGVTDPVVLGALGPHEACLFGDFTIFVGWRTYAGKSLWDGVNPSQLDVRAVPP
jgi:hypothetical protein